MKTSANNPQTSNSSELRPGIYRNRNGNQRLLFAVIDRRCIYGMGDINSRLIHLTTCSPKTFIESAGMKFIRQFKVEEIASVKTKFVPLASCRTANKAERNLFFSLQGLGDLIEAMGAETSAMEEETSVVQEKYENGHQNTSWYKRMSDWFIIFFRPSRNGLGPVINQT